MKWTSEVPKCDKPSLAGGVTLCGLNSRINFVERNHVEWLFLCRKSSDDLEIRAEPYWTENDPRFSRYSAIGFNRTTGEIAFIDGRKDRSVFNWSRSFPPPGGQSYHDLKGRLDAEALYDTTFSVDCVSCHDNKKPTIIDPHIQQARVGYYDNRNDPRAEKFSLGNFLPPRIARTDSPFRVIGSGYTSAHEGQMRHAKAFSIQKHPCSGCHSLTTLQTGRRFAADAASMAPGVTNPTLGQSVGIAEERAALRLVQDHRTDWASASGAGRIMPWMIPQHGGKLSGEAEGLDLAQWEQLSECAWGKGGDVCNYRPLFTGCPTPGGSGDTFVPSDFSIRPRFIAEAGSLQSVLSINWTYLNGYGGVPERDDVRFNIAIRLVDLPISQRTPEALDYPSMADARATETTAVTDNISRTVTKALVIHNASFSSHQRLTEPAPTTKPRNYSIFVPATCGKRYLVRVVPKRFCFDETGVTYSDQDYLLHYDHLCVK